MFCDNELSTGTRFEAANSFKERGHTYADVERNESYLIYLPNNAVYDTSGCRYHRGNTITINNESERGSSRYCDKGRIRT